MICDKCLHVNVCGEEGASEPALTYCADYIGWIPVSERLPEDGERVLITYDEIVIEATWDLMRYCFYDTYAVSLDKDFVYAWMPLPEPYKAEGSEKE